MKRRTVLLVCLMLALFMLVACGGKKEPQETVASAATETPVPTEIPATQVPTPEPVRTVSFAHGELPLDAREAAIVLESGETAKLEELKELQSLTLDGSICYEEIIAYRDAHPEVAVHYTVGLGGAFYDAGLVELSLPVTAVNDLMRNAVYLPELKSVSVSGSMNAKDAANMREALPELEIRYTVSIAGKEYASDAEVMDLCGIEPSKAAEIAAALPALPELKWICLNPESHKRKKAAEENEDVVTVPCSAEYAESYVPAPAAADYFDILSGIKDTGKASKWTLEQVGILQQGKAGIAVDYPVNAFGISFSTADDILTLSGIRMKGKTEELKGIAAYMTNCSMIEMEECGIGNEEMEKLRDALAPVDVVWKIKCGPYSCRTDAVMIKFAGKSPSMTDSDVKALKYCTKCRYLDLGHNHLKHMDFVTEMPDLEVAIIAVNYIQDCDPIGNCTKLEYLELLSGGIKSIATLENLVNLEHLNIAYNKIKDISPLYGLTKLKRCWISRNKYPEEQAAILREKLPECEVNDTAHNPTSGGWRHDEEHVNAERYDLLREQFQYENTRLRSYYVRRGQVVGYYTNKN